MDAKLEEFSKNHDCIRCTQVFIHTYDSLVATIMHIALKAWNQSFTNPQRFKPVVRKNEWPDELAISYCLADQNSDPEKTYALLISSLEEIVSIEIYTVPEIKGRFLELIADHNGENPDNVIQLG